jgi:outer membrane usher protein
VCSRKSKRHISVLLALVLCLTGALEMATAFAEPAHPRPLQLEVFINNDKTGLTGSFSQLPDGSMAASRGELEEVGVKVPGSGKADEDVVLDTISGLVYRYDERTQTIAFTLNDDHRVPHAYDAAGGPAAALPVRSGYGSVLNYTLFAGSSTAFANPNLAFNGASASLDARFFSPFGTLSQTGILRSTTERDADALRLDTTFTYSDPSSLVTYRAGDAISGGLPWTRSIRFGGVQVQRNFGLRSDLITNPLPAFSGSAAVPSTVDVYMNNVKTYSQDVPAGPFNLSNLPAVAGGTASVVLRDSAGREVRTDLPFYSSPTLLREGLTYFSGEAGYPRIHYGTQSDNYVEQAFAALSMRHGWFDWLTVEGHAEGGAGLFNAGAGLVARTGSFGVLSLAASGSGHGGDRGLQVFAAYDTRLFGLSLNVSTQRSFGDYDDLASVTAPIVPAVNAFAVPIQTSVRPPKALDRVSVGMPLPFDTLSNLNWSFIHLKPATGPTSKIVSASWSRPFVANSHLFVTAFSDFGEKRNYGVFAGLSIQLGQWGSASTSVVNGRDGTGRDGTSVTTDYTKPLTQDIGSYGWRVRDSEGAVSDRSAAAAYRSSFARIEAGVQQSNGTIRGQAEVQGGVATMGNGVFFSNRIEDSFAVVDAGAPGVDVFYENRLIGKTNGQGLLLVPSMRSYQKNKISIDPHGLPLNADVQQTQDFVAPADRSGVALNFGVKTKVNAAVVIIARADGKVLPVGSKGLLNDSDESFVVGYDGRAYVRGLQSENTITVTAGGNECRASFPFTSEENSQVVIGPVVCQ